MQGLPWSEETEADMLAQVNDIARQWYVDPNRRNEFATLMNRDGRTTDFISEVFRHKTRDRIWVSESAWLVRDKEGNPAYYEGMVVDATERRRTEAEIAHLALHDMLTRLPNRTLFLNTLTAALARLRPAAEPALPSQAPVAAGPLRPPARAERQAQVPLVFQL